MPKPVAKFYVTPETIDWSKLSISPAKTRGTVVGSQTDVHSVLYDYGHKIGAMDKFALKIVPVDTNDPEALNAYMKRVFISSVKYEPPTKKDPTNPDKQIPDPEAKKERLNIGMPLFHVPPEDDEYKIEHDSEFIALAAEARLKIVELLRRQVASRIPFAVFNGRVKPVFYERLTETRTTPEGKVVEEKIKFNNDVSMECTSFTADDTAQTIMQKYRDENRTPYLYASHYHWKTRKEKNVEVFNDKYKVDIKGMKVPCSMWESTLNGQYFAIPMFKIADITVRNAGGVLTYIPRVEVEELWIKVILKKSQFVAVKAVKTHEDEDMSDIPAELIAFHQGSQQGSESVSETIPTMTIIAPPTANNTGHGDFDAINNIM